MHVFFKVGFFLAIIYTNYLLIKIAMNIFYYICGKKQFLINIVIFEDFSVIPVISCVISVKTVISVNTVISFS